MKWPGVVAAGSTCDALVHHADLFRTVADLLDQVVEPTAGEDSFNLLPLLRGERESIREHAISHSANGLASLRLGSWKLIAGEAEVALLEQSITDPAGSERRRVGPPALRPCVGHR
ncbi:MAG: hypothetical protein R3B96_01800 [Pirellulaceae bacterium]